MKVELEGAELELLPERAIYWAEHRALLVADLHLGKPESFQARGIPVPSDLVDDELERLGQSLGRTGAQTLWILGDMLHDEFALDPVLNDRIVHFRNRHPALRVVLVRGNHDRHVPELPADWKVDECDTATLGPFRLRHHPRASPEGWVFSGHLHPMVKLVAGGDRLLLPCFHFDDRTRVGVLPAFSTFSSGVRMRRGQNRVFAIADDEVFQV